MSESRVFGTLIGEICEAELADSPKPLKFNGVDQRFDQFTFGGTIVQPDNIMNRISIISF